MLINKYLNYNKTRWSNVFLYTFVYFLKKQNHYSHLLLLITAALGNPVVPDVYINKSLSRGFPAFTSSIKFAFDTSAKPFFKSIASPKFVSSPSLDLLRMYSFISFNSPNISLTPS